MAPNTLGLPATGLIPITFPGMTTIFYPLHFLREEQWDLWERAARGDLVARQQADAITRAVVRAESAAMRCPN